MFGHQLPKLLADFLVKVLGLAFHDFFDFVLGLLDVVVGDFIGLNDLLEHRHGGLGDLLAGFGGDLVAAGLGEQLDFVNCCEFAWVYCSIDYFSS